MKGQQQQQGVSLKTALYRQHPVPLRDLQAGDTFRLHWEGGNHPGGTEGVLLYLGAGSARVRIKGGKQTADFVDKNGKAHYFEGAKISETDWSLGTLVYKLGEDEAVREAWAAKQATRAGGSMQNQKRAVSLKPSRVQSEDEHEQEDKTMATKKTTKAAKANGKAEAKALNPCLCACGTMVKKRFAQGHDARYFGWLKKVVGGDKPFSELPKPVQARLKDKAGAKRELATH